jgi:signal transduction histidine kinase
MEDLSLHILDVVENSVRAGAGCVSVRLTEDRRAERLTLEIDDDGGGMDEETKARCLDPYFTTKSGKEVGLGLAFLAQSAEDTGGHLSVESEKGKGTRVTAVYGLNHIDLRPLGDVNGTIRCLRATHPELDLRYEYVTIER